MREIVAATAPVASQNETEFDGFLEHRWRNGAALFETQIHHSLLAPSARSSARASRMAEKADREAAHSQALEAFLEEARDALCRSQQIKQAHADRQASAVSRADGPASTLNVGDRQARGVSHADRRARPAPAGAHTVRRARPTLRLRRAPIADEQLRAESELDRRRHARRLRRQRADAAAAMAGAIAGVRARASMRPPYTSVQPTAKLLLGMRACLDIFKGFPMRSPHHARRCCMSRGVAVACLEHVRPLHCGTSVLSA